MKHISPSTEYVLVYAKDLEKTKTERVARSQKALEYYKNPDNDPKGLWRPTPIHAGPPAPANIYAIQSPFLPALSFFQFQERPGGMKKVKLEDGWKSEVLNMKKRN
jgi:hypothetical protein